MFIDKNEVQEHEDEYHKHIECKFCSCKIEFQKY